MSDRAGTRRERREIQGRRAVVVARPGGAERDLVSVAQKLFAANPLAVDVGPVQAPEVAEDELAFPLLEDAVLLRDDLVEELDGVVGVAPQAVDRAELNRL